jgi:NAD(P)-dependent dehydrogenase (short-subunit alcohol dehydrogenase family)
MRLVKADLVRCKVLITGVSPKSIGYSTALAFASQQPGLLILASRSLEKMKSVVSSIQESYPGVRVEIVQLDLSSQDSIRSAATAVKQLTDTLDILINNAAAVVYSRQTTAEGIELQFGVNHIGPFLFTNLLLPLMLRAAASSSPGSVRIVNLTSAGHRLSPMRFSDYNLEKESDSLPDDEKPVSPLPPMFSRVTTDDGYNGTIAYGQSKTANILFTVYLQEHLGKKGIASYVLHPGSKSNLDIPTQYPSQYLTMSDFVYVVGIETDLGRDQDQQMAKEFVTIAKYWKTLDEGASTTMVAALDPALNGEFTLLSLLLIVQPTHEYRFTKSLPMGLSVCRSCSFL